MSHVFEQTLKNIQLMKRFFVFATSSLLALWLTGCGGRSTTSNIPTLALGAAIDNPQAFDLSEIVEEIEFIELDKNVPVGEISDFMGLQPATNGFYIVSTNFFSPVLHFDRTGQFVSEIGRIGRGPYETAFIAGLAANEDTGDVYVDGGFQVVGFDAEGRGFARNDSIMTYGLLWYGDRLLVPANPPLLDENAYVGDSIPFIQLFDRDLKSVGSIYGPNVGPFDGSPAGEPLGGEAPASSPPFMSYNGHNLVIKQGRNDTLYYYETGGIRPAWLIDLGNHVPPEQVFGLEAPERWNDRYYSVDNLLEGERYLIITANNRQDEPLRRLIFDRNDLSSGFSAVGGTDNEPGLFIDGIAFTPAYLRDNNLVGYMQAFNITDNAEGITDPRFKSLAADLEEDSNPVIVVLKLKR